MVQSYIPSVYNSAWHVGLPEGVCWTHGDSPCLPQTTRDKSICGHRPVTTASKESRLTLRLTWGKHHLKLVHGRPCKCISLPERMGQGPRLPSPGSMLGPVTGPGLAVYVPVTLLQQVALLLAAVFLVTLKLVHAVASLPALGILERRCHGLDSCQRQFSTPWLSSAMEHLPGAKRIVDFESCWVLDHTPAEETGRVSNCQTSLSWGLGSGSPISSLEASSTSETLQRQAILGLKLVYAGSRDECRKGQGKRSGHQAKLMHPERSSSGQTASPSPFC